MIVCNWADEENFWPGAAGDATDPFAPASGLVPFLAARRRLDEIGARVPRLLWADDTERRHPADVAVVEDVADGTLEALLASEPGRARAVLDDLARTLELMQRHYVPR